jgi:chaperonin GroEL
MKFTNKKFKFNKEAIDALLEGAKVVYDAVRITMGPAGKLVVSDQKSVYPTATKDGVTVASMIKLKDPFKDLGAQLLIQAARRQVTESGDGTTLTIVLAYAMLKYGIDAIVSGCYNSTVLIYDMEHNLKEAIGRLKEISKQVTNKKELESVATIACNGNKEIGEMIAKAITKVGKYGIVSKSKSLNTKNYVTFTNGYEWNRGIEHQNFMTDNGSLNIQDPYILVTDKPISWGSDLIKVCGIVKTEPLVIIAENVKDEALLAIMKSKEKGYNISVISIGGIGLESKYKLEDIAALTGATLISDESGVDITKNIELKHFGTCKKISSFFRYKTAIFGTDATKRVEGLKSRLKTVDNSYEAEIIKESIAKLTGGIAIIHVGGNSETEQEELLDRVDDAILATRAAQEEGIVAGGGVALIKLQGNNPSSFLSIFKTPIKQILENADFPGFDDISFCKSLLNGGGYSLESRESTSESMIEQNIIDPTKVIRTALLNSFSVVKMMLQSRVLVVDDD